MKDGIYRAVSDYHNSDGLSNSRMKLLERSAAHYKYAMEHPEPSGDSGLFGSVVHALVLEPDKPQWWIVAPEMIDFRTKEGKSWKAAQQQPVIKYEDFQRAKGCAEAVLNDTNASRCFTAGIAEVPVYHTDNVTGVQLRGKLDYVTPGRAICDLKTCDDARWDEFAKQFRKHRYARQMALYLDIWNGQAERCGYTQKTDFVFVAVEVDPPHGVCLHHFATTIPCSEMVDPTYALGCSEYKRLAAYYADTIKQNRFPGYPTEPVYRGEELTQWEKRKAGV